MFFVSSNFYILAHSLAFVNNFFKNFFAVLLFLVDSFNILSCCFQFVNNFFIFFSCACRSQRRKRYNTKPLPKSQHYFSIFLNFFFSSYFSDNTVDFCRLPAQPELPSTVNQKETPSGLFSTPHSLLWESMMALTMDKPIPLPP